MNSELLLPNLSLYQKKKNRDTLKIATVIVINIWVPCFLRIYLSIHENNNEDTMKIVRVIVINICFRV